MPETVLLGFRRGAPRRLLVVQGPKGDEGEQGLPGATLASGVSFTPAGSISATTVQGALVELDTDKQPVDTDLTTIAGLDSTTAGALVTDGGGWIRKSYAQLKTALGLSKADLGLSAVDNTSDAAKPLSSAAVTALAAKADLVGGTVPASQLPSYVDDVLEFANLAAFPGVGETGKIYVAKDTNLTFRWTGSAYGVLDPSLALGETVSTAYRGDRGKTAYDHSQITSGNPHGTTYSDVGADAAGAAASAQAAAIAAAAADATTKANAAQSAATSAAATDATNKVATEATARNTAITNAVNALVAAAPGALDTLKELADALGDDPNFASTMTTALAGKASTAALSTETTNRTNADEVVRKKAVAYALVFGGN